MSCMLGCCYSDCKLPDIILGWPNSSFRFLLRWYGKTQMNFLANPNTKSQTFLYFSGFLFRFFLNYFKEMRDCFSVYFAGCKSIYVTLVLGRLSICRLGKKTGKIDFFFPTWSSQSALARSTHF